MSVHPEVIRIARDIRTMKVRGAGRIARSAAGALKIAARSSKAKTPSEFKREMDNVSRTLLKTRPTAVSLPNAIRFVSLPIETMKSAGVEELRKAVMRRADDFIRNSLHAVKFIGETGARKIRNGDAILTHCNSECALSVIKTAHLQRKSIHVFATESRPRRQGFITIRYLTSNKIPCTLIVDSAVRFFMKHIDRVVVGADVIMANGTLVNKIGTSQIALAAHEAGVPFTVAAETYKLHPGSASIDEITIEERDPSEVVDPAKFPGATIRNPAFDITPPKYIETIITEMGEVTPNKVKSLIDRVFSWGTEKAPVLALNDSEET
ncbi:MAG: ribose 1,5-bisphosphate isomerase [Candidatus Hadarchaeales archaeon]